MGKKKSKAGKQKQAKAKAASQKRKQNAKFNIPISSDGTMITNSSNKKDKKTIPKKIQNKMIGKMNLKDNTRSKKTREDQDFEDEYKSLLERQHAAQLKKTNKKKQNSLVMAPATLQVNQKPTTQQLVDDAANHLHGMQELGMLSGAAIGGNPNANLLQVLAAQKRREDYLAQQEAMKPREIGEGNNFWALQDDSSDDEDKKNSSTPAFNFAAPSFSFTPATNFGSGTTTVLDDDPDL
ncbi:predicted protein [Chaetoceros tenuissimus]|uniref:Uncharacterized protein n=1 Tax=Chaetoceros tenuissimus TaxID=426638 RepID=A0AAD3D8Y1_9STRA|nr:predicted protein [Chaetoceros tenuissimus]